MAVFLQILLSVVILSLTVLVVAAGIQVFHILHEVRNALKRVNHILQNTDTLSSASAKPITAVNEFFSEVRTLITKTEDSIIESTPDRVIETPPHSAPIHSTSSLKSRFFRRSGAPLRAS